MLLFEDDDHITSSEISQEIAVCSERMSAQY